MHVSKQLVALAPCCLLSSHCLQLQLDSELFKGVYGVWRPGNLVIFTWLHWSKKRFLIWITTGFNIKAFLSKQILPPKQYPTPLITTHSCTHHDTHAVQGTTHQQTQQYQWSQAQLLFPCPVQLAARGTKERARLGWPFFVRKKLSWKIWCFVM